MSLEGIHVCAICASHCFNPFAIHLIIGVRTCKIKACITLLIDEQVRKIHLHDYITHM